MILSKLQLVNFRNYRSTNFNFSEGANTIIGENDSGKSNAVTALRMLLDEEYYYSVKSLKESDFNREINGFKGHWIIISAEFDNISENEMNKEVIASLRNEMTNVNLEQGHVSLIIRPNFKKRQEMFEASTNELEFENVRSSIRLSDYEFIYRGKMITDFTDERVYKEIVGDFENFISPDPNDKQENAQVIGTKIDIKDITAHISIVFIDALRDVLRTMNSSSNPIKKIVGEIENKIQESDFIDVKNKIKDLNQTITGIKEIGNVRHDLNNKLVDILGLVYSPELSLTSNISDELKSLSKFLNIKPNDEDSIGSLGLGHLNMIFIALKIVEYNICSSREVLNIMLIEEPEAHIHHHIQRTLFQNLGIKEKTIQVVMTTHSPNIAESSEISRMNIVKSIDGKSVAMSPTSGLNTFGSEKLNIKIDLSKAIERYLDAKRSAILFSKGVLLVEGDAEEILIPNLIKKTLGVSLDEIGVGVVNIGSTAFEYIAPIFSKERINRKCAIITDLDKQAVSEKIIKKGEIVGNKLYKKNAEEKGNDRREKIENLFKDNDWVESFYAETTFEIEFAKSNPDNQIYLKTISDLYKSEGAITNWENKIYCKENLYHEGMLVASSEEIRSNGILSLAENIGKGWLATIMSENILSSQERFVIPHYIIKALSFISSESINEKIIKKMIVHSMGKEESIDNFLLNNDNAISYPCLYSFINEWKKEREK
ncbi:MULTISPECIES: AAA family ATPase [Lactococcus]|uniref:AAA family ATPase n=1 Tax=Lactococcus TaxID=1357 RepID=UPI000266B7D2|nr:MULTISPECIES: AAA family ATPase [Lactococcus]EIT67551.1 Recombinational DNA repair ATPase, RecF_1 [Lactococcus garvieae IPLA 31405]UHU66446.1 AAA family ATPase [Lactococcus garvieae]UQU60720.1 DNA replication and repair protein RecF [Lactococcus petauri]